MASVFPITWMVLEKQGEIAAQRLVKWVALLGIAMVVVAYGQLFYLLQQPDFTPIQQLKEDSMPYLLPFILLFINRLTNTKLRWLGIITASSVILFYIFLSEGRAAQLAAVFALFLFFVIALNVRWYAALLTCMACMLAVILGNLETFVQLSGSEQGIYDVMNQFTSYRWELWDNALTHAPGWNLIGYGMGNIRYIDQIVTFASGSKVAHVHNFILDLWLETGWFGLIAFLLFITSIISAAVNRFATLQFEKRMIVGAALAGSGAILLAGLFSFSYNSKQFGVYLMLCLALLLWSALSKPIKEHDAG
jgi:O-antigen ligase